MFMEGGPSQIDLFDPKPELRKVARQAAARGDDEGPAPGLHQAERRRPGQPANLPAVRQSGIEFSDFIPNIGSCADDLCLVRSMYTDAFNHHPGQLLLFGGSIQVGRPTMGAWVLYGLGQRIAESAGLRGAQLRRGHQRRLVQLVQRISAVDLPGRGVAQRGRPGAVPFESRRASPARCSAPASIR